MDFVEIRRKLFEVEQPKQTFINMYVKYTINGEDHVRNFTNEKEYDKFCDYIRKNAQVTSYECSKTYKKVTE